MFNFLNLEHILFLDIETVPYFPSYADMTEEWRDLWDYKSTQLRKTETDTPATLYPRAGIYAEFGKIICISCGYVKQVDGQTQFRLKSFASDDEKKLLTEFSVMLKKHFSKADHKLCAHNGKEFDFPYIARRMVIHGMELPGPLDIAGKKPWETPMLDTMEMWKFGDYKSFTSLAVLAHVLNVPTPKDDIDGSQVHIVYYEDNDLPRIVTYCQKDVLTVAQILRRFRGEPLILPEDVIIN
ncbi:MAG: 3'-5' exonuclease [Bacteroidia bacterium]